MRFLLKSSLVQRSKASWLGGAAMLLGLVGAAYFPIYQAGCIWDDEAMVFDNSLMKTVEGLQNIWFSTQSSDYLPLTFTSFWLEWRLWGNHPAGYHAVNVLLHGLGSVLLWRVLRQLQIRGAWVAAAIFAVHPVSVASVAWIAERKNTLSLVFYLLSIGWFLRFTAEARRATDGGRCNRWYAFSLVFFLLALLSKTSVVTLPLVLWLCLWWRGRQEHPEPARPAAWWGEGRKWFGLTLPFLVLSLVFGLITIWFQNHRAIGETVSSESFWTRSLSGSWGLWFYLGKILWPIHLSMIYPRWTADPGSILSYLPGLAWLGLLLVSWWWRLRWGAIFFAGSYFTLLLAPVIGVFNMYFLNYSRVADHWQYLASIGIMALVVSGGVAWFSRLAAGKYNVFFSWFGGAVAALVLAFFFMATFRRVQVFQNKETLWRDTLGKNPGSWVAHNNLGIELDQRGERQAAIFHYTKAIHLFPNYADAYYNLGKNLDLAGEKLAAMERYRQALQADAKYFRAHNNLGVILEGQGRTEEALAHYAEAVRLSPKYAVAHNNLANLLLPQGKTEAALFHGQEAVRAKPDFPEAHYNVANALVALGKFSEAGEAFTNALHCRPNYMEAHYNLANLLVRQNQLPLARWHFSAAMAGRPSFAEAWNNLGNTFALEGKWREAAENYAAALRIDPAHPRALHGLGLAWLNLNLPAEAEAPLRRSIAGNAAVPEPHWHLGLALWRQKKTEEAGAQFRQAIQLRPQMAEPYFYLGMMAVQAGREGEAVEYFRAAVRWRPMWREPANNLAWILATSGDPQIRDGREALVLAARALAENRTAAMLDTWAAASAAAGDFSAALSAGEEALQLARTAGDESLSREIVRRLELYRAGKAFRQSLENSH